MIRRCGCSCDVPVLVPVQTTKLVRSDTLEVVSTNKETAYVTCCECGTYLSPAGVISDERLKEVLDAANKECNK